jgi:glycosyltransferase involved in cell wall biosynthesis
MNGAPALSFVIAARDAARYVENAVASALVQRGVDVEVIVVDDGSVDATSAVLARLTDPRLRVLRLPQSIGPFGAALRGIALARAPWVFRLDADDVALPERAEQQLAMLERAPSVGLVGAAAEIIDEDGAPIGCWQTPTSAAAVWWRACTAMPFAHSSFAWKKQALDDASVAYRADRHVGDDYGLLARLMAVSAVAACPDVLVSYRRVADGISATHRAVQDLAHHETSLAIARLLDPHLDADAHALVRAAIRGQGPAPALAGLLVRRFDALVAACRARGLQDGLEEAAACRDDDLRALRG